MTAADDGYSGVSFNRPQFKKLEEAIRKGALDCIVVKDLSRFSRNYIDGGRYIEKIFPQLGIRFIAINAAYDSLTGDPQSDSFVIPFKNLINDSYCKDKMCIRDSDIPAVLLDKRITAFQKILVVLLVLRYNDLWYLCLLYTSPLQRDTLPVVPDR